MTGSEIVAVKQGISLAATTAAGVIKIYRANNTVAKQELQLLRVRAEETIALARISAIGQIYRAIMEELVDTSRQIEALPPESIALPYIMDQLEHMHRRMRRIIDDF